MVSPVLAQAILQQSQQGLGDIVGAFEAGAEKRRQRDVRDLTGLVLQGGERGQEAFTELQGLDPTIALTLQEKIRANDQSEVNDFLRDARIGNNLLGAGNIEGFLAFADQRAQIIRNRGGDPSQTERIADLVRSGNVEQAQNELTALNKSIQDTKGIDNVARSEILPGGITRIVTRKGNVIVKRGDEVLQGEEAQKAVAEAEQQQIAKKGQETEEIERGKRRVELNQSINKEAQTARNTLQRTKRIRRALELAKTGRTTEARQQISRFIPGVSSPTAEALNSEVTEFALSLKDQLLGGGILSDSDVLLLKSIVPQLGNTLEGNLLIVQRFEQIANNAIERAQRFKQFKEQGGDPLEFEIDDTSAGVQVAAPDAAPIDQGGSPLPPEAITAPQPALRQDIDISNVGDEQLKRVAKQLGISVQEAREKLEEKRLEQQRQQGGV